MDLRVGDTVWVDEGDGPGCVEFRGVIEQITGETLSVRVTSHPIGGGAATGSLRPALIADVFEHTAAAP